MVISTDSKTAATGDAARGAHRVLAHDACGLDDTHDEGHHSTRMVARTRDVSLALRTRQTPCITWRMMTTLFVLSLTALGWAVSFYLGRGAGLRVGARAMAEHVVDARLGVRRKDRPLVEMVTRVVVHRCAALPPDELQTLSARLRP